MVKNNNGGYHKGNARKDSIGRSNKTRLSIDPSELYAKVTKLFGGNRCEVFTHTGLTLSCVIRGKFSGKFKHSNLISVNSFVLVGIHDWASDKSTCDLLHVYQINDLHSLSDLIPSLIDSSFHFDIPFDHHIDSIDTTIDSTIDSIDIIDLYSI